MLWKERLKSSKKQSFSKVYIQEMIDTKDFICLQGTNYTLLIGDYDEITTFIKEYHYHVLYEEITSRNSAYPLLSYQNIHARIEPGAIIRDQVVIENQAVILMGAIINIGAIIQERVMVDMNAVIGSGAIIEHDSHIGAGAVVAGMLEPNSSKPVHIKHHCMIGANATILEGITVGEFSVIGANSVVTKDVEPYSVMVGVPARYIKNRNQVEEEKVAIVDELRKL